MCKTFTLSLLLLAAASPRVNAGRPMIIDDLLAARGVSDPQVSPDGSLVVYVLSEIDRASGKTNSDLWIVPSAGGEPRRMTTSPAPDNHPRWSPDGKTIAFVSKRDETAQVCLLPVDGGEARPITRLPIDVSGPIWSPNGQQIAFTAQVYPGTTPDITARRDKEKTAAKSQALTYDRLMFRHWDRWDDGKRSHLFICDLPTGGARDLTPDWPVNIPPAPFGGSSDYVFSPDGQTLAFVSEPLSEPATSTNTDIWSVSVLSGSPVNLTADNKAADAQPSFSPDGKTIALLTQKRPGFESDQWVLKLMPRDQPNSPPRDLTSSLDRPVLSYAWSRDGSAILANIDDQGTEPIVSISPEPGTNTDTSTDNAPPSTAKPLVSGAANGSIQSTPDNAFLIFTRHSANRPAELYRTASDGSGLTQLTHHNDPLLADLDLHEAESFTFPGADDDPVQAWLVRPPAFDPARKYPVLLLIHGGPQSAFHDEWHNRWNYSLFASPGYVVLAVNPRGSTGFGQKFTDQISGDWSGRVYEDIIKGLDHALEKYPFLDGDKIAAAGGSYGGYMVNWLCAHSNRFRALISHAGVFDLESEYGGTEELWFPEWEFGGPPWQEPDAYRAMSPSTYAGQLNTPTLVIHGALDFRVPDNQGLALFTSLQRRGVPSRLVYFPDEGHWILKPDNRVTWWREVHAWLARFLKSPLP